MTPGRKTSKSPNTGTGKSKKGGWKMVRNSELNEEIQALQKRLFYLKKRRELGRPPYARKGQKRYYVQEKTVNPEESELHIFYREHILNGTFKKEYAMLYKDMMTHTRAFVEFHNSTFNAIEKYGTEEHKAAFKELLTGNDVKIDSADIKF